MNRISVINTIIDHTGARQYLEIGVKHGLSFMQVNAEKRTGVDPGWPGLKFYWYLAKKRQMRFFKITSDRFFEKHRPTLEKNGIDIALVDGLHEYHQSLRDVENCLKYLSPGGAIVLHDCNPQSEGAALSPCTPAGRQRANQPGTWNGDVWKTIVYLRSHHDDLRVFVLDCDHGVGVVTRGKPEGMLDFDKEAIDEMGYATLEQDRSHILNLRPPDYIHKFMVAHMAT